MIKLIKKFKSYDRSKVSLKEFYEIEATLPRFIKNFSLYFGQDKLKKITSLVKLKKKSLILDLGCGTGYLSKVLRKKDYRVVGLDISERRIREAGEGFIVGDASRPPFKKGAFDCVIASDVIEHLPGNLMSHVKTITNLLNKNGKLVISVPYGFANNDRGHIHKLSIPEWETLFRKAGLKTNKKESAYYSIMSVKTPVKMNYVYSLSKK